MSSIAIAVVILGGVLAAVITGSAAYIVWRSGAAKGWKETAEAFKTRSEEQALTIRDLATAGDTRAQQIEDLNEALTVARERIAKLEDRPDLSVVVAGLSALAESESVRHEAHEQRALERHEAIVSALTALTLRIEAR